MFKPKSEAIQVGIDVVKIPCRNGTVFQEDSIVRFDLPRSLGFAQLSNAYIECEVLLENPDLAEAAKTAMPPCSLERQSGAQSLINRVSIRSSGRLIEQLEGYNVMANLAYNATHTSGSMNKRSRLEGCAPSYMINDSPWYTTNKCVSSITNAQRQVAGGMTAGLTAASECLKAVRRKVCIPLNTGLFNSPHAFGLAMMPLEVELILEKALRAMRISNYGDAEVDVAGTVAAGAAGTYQARQLIVDARRRYNGLGGNDPIPTTNATASIQGQQEMNMLNNFPYRVGQVVRLSGAGTTPANYTIAQIAVSEAGAANQGHIIVHFTADIIDAGNAGGVGVMHPLNAAGGVLGANPFTYRIFNPRMCVPKVIPPPETVNAMYNAMAKGAISQDIVTYTAYDNAIPSTQTTSTNIISAELTRAKAILSVPISQANLDDVTNSNALCGQYLDANEYYFQINNKLVPDRNVQLAREATPARVALDVDEIIRPYKLGSCPSGFHIFELEKALRSGDIRVKNLNFVTSDANVATFAAQEPGSWCVGRSLAANVGTSMNLTGKTCILYLNYRATSNMVKLLRNFVVHVRTIQFGQEGVQVFF